MNIQVTRASSGCSVQVSVVPPPGTVAIGGSMQTTLDKFTANLKTSVPDVIVSSK